MPRIRVCPPTLAERPSALRQHICYFYRADDKPLRGGSGQNSGPPVPIPIPDPRSQIPVIEPTTSGVLIRVRVIPRAGRSGLAGTRDGALLVRLAALPVEGAANAALIDLIAELLHVPRRAVTIVSGGRSRSKTVRVDGVDIDAATRALH